MNSLPLKRHNSFQNEYNRKTTHAFAPRPQFLYFNKMFFKFNDITKLQLAPQKLTWRQIFEIWKIEVLRISVFLDSNFKVNF